MTNRLGLGLTLIAVALFVTSSTGVSTVAVERSVEIEVVEDDEALVGFEHSNDTSELLTVTNRAGTEINVTELETDGLDTNDGLQEGDRIESGESGAIEADVDCSDGNEESVPIDIAVAGDGITIERTVEVEVCED